ncbi:MAG: hypothetical protein JJU29_02840, partial [Verrucomicrobia bacterium]|nr:hypothetical protein [Verrucomicrobiota bacterium]
GHGRKRQHRRLPQRQRRHPLHQVDFGHDHASRLHTVGHAGHTVTHARTPADELRLAQTFHNGAANVLTVEHRFDRQDRLTSRLSLPAGHAPRGFTYAHNLLNQRTRAERSDGTREENGSARAF